jgi:broad specificity phosphatase PhoE
MTHVVLIRPGSTEYDEQHRLQGALDLPLCDRGRAEVDDLAERLREHEFAAVYSGPCASVLRTAEAIARAHGLRPRRVDELRNVDFGLWQGLLLDELKRRNGRLFRLWVEDPRSVCPPQGESIELALDRIKGAVRPLIKRHRDEMIGLVASNPIAHLISSYLRRSSKLRWTHEPSSATIESIEVSPEVLANGESH